MPSFETHKQLYPLSSREAPILSIDGRRGDRLAWQTCPFCAEAFPKQIPPRRMCHRCDSNKQRKLILDEAIDRVLPGKLCDALCARVRAFFEYDERRAGRRWYDLCVLMGPYTRCPLRGFRRFTFPWCNLGVERKQQRKYLIQTSRVMQQILSYLFGEGHQAFDIIIQDDVMFGCALRLCVKGLKYDWPSTHDDDDSFLYVLVSRRYSGVRTTV